MKVVTPPPSRSHLENLLSWKRLAIEEMEGFGKRSTFRLQERGGVIFPGRPIAAFSPVLEKNSDSSQMTRNY